MSDLEHLKNIQQCKTSRHLVVDDAKINRQLLKLFLQSEHFTVDEANDGKAALEAIEKAGVDGYDVIWTDLHMFGMGGLELAREVRKRGYRKYIVVLTGDASPDVRLKCKDTGVDLVILKPFRRKDIRELPVMQL